MRSIGVEWKGTWVLIIWTIVDAFLS